MNKKQSYNRKTKYRTWLNGGVHLLKKHYNISSVKQKQKLLSSIFPENLYFEGEQCRTTRINDVLRFILQRNNSLVCKKKGQI